MAEKFYIPAPPPPTAPPYDTNIPLHPPHAQPPRPPHPHSPHHADLHSPKLEYSLYPEKVIISLSALLFSLLTISLSYAAVFPSSEIYRVTIAPLVTSTVFLVVAIVSALYLFTVPGLHAKLAILPILFAAVSGSMVILLNVSSKALSDGGFVDVNFRAVLLSAGVFGGVALGSSASFLLFAHRRVG